jgi:hypothetical protein
MRRAPVFRREVTMDAATRLLKLALPAVLVLSPVWAQDPASEDQAYGDDYRAGESARIRYEDNGVTILRGGQERPEGTGGTLNAPVFASDTLETGRDQRVEVQLPGGSLVRLDRETSLTFLSIPSPYAGVRDATVLQLADGTIRISARLAEGEQFRVDTPAASIYLLDDGDFRVEGGRGGETRVASWRGVAEVSAEGGSVLVRAGMWTVVSPETAPDDPVAFNTFAADDFDRWVARREDAERESYASSSSGDDNAAVYDDLPYEVRPYYRELARSGRWVYAVDYGYVWHPVGVAVGWRPYWNGYWVYGPAGYFWVSYEPWGWAPYHYGRWGWVPGYGWCWIPGHLFAGAWVSWSWGSLYVGWSPLDYWDRPAHYGLVYYGYYDPHCWTFVSYAHLHHRHYHPYAVSVRAIGDDLHRHAVVTRAPRVAPQRLAREPAARTRAFLDARAEATRAAARVARLDRVEGARKRFTEIEQQLIRRPLRRFGEDRGAGPERIPRAADIRDTVGASSERPAPERRPAATPRSRPSPTVERPERSIPEAGTRPRFPSRIATSRPAGAVSRAASRATADRPDRETPRVDRPVARPPRLAPPSSRLDAGAARERLRELYRSVTRPRESHPRPTPPPRVTRPSVQGPPGHRVESARRPPTPATRRVPPSRAPADHRPARESRRGGDSERKASKHD